MTEPGYIPKNDVVQRHEQGVTKSRKTVLTGGGRAWSESEEDFLVKTRHQKVPYKHIANHLKKTELACRLHFHQLTHGSGRRKHSLSAPPPLNRSLDMTATIPPPSRHRTTGSVSSHRRAESYSSTSTSSSAGDMQLPRITDRWTNSTLPAILPKPMAMSASGPRYLPRLYEELGHLPPLPPQTHQYHDRAHTPMPYMERRSFSLPSTATQPPPYIDLPRLHAVYDAHRDAFWRLIASEYGHNVSPAVLETAWKSSEKPPPGRPMTPAASPEAETRRDSVDRTSIASILREDYASPRKW